jgi:ArsR family transcriptional regulator
VARVDAAEIYDLYERVCKALADPKRLLIINALRDGPRSVGEIAEDLQMSQPNTSQHLAILRERNVVRTSRRGTVVYYSLTSTKILAAIDTLRQFLAEVSAMEETGDLAG